MSDEQYIDIAIEISKNAKYPYGAIVVKDNQIIGRSDDKTLMETSMYSHAELEAIESASKNKNLYGDLKGATMYVSCEPCMMCMGAILYEGFSKIVYSATLQDSNDYYCPEMITNIDELAKYSNSNIEIVKELHRDKAIEVLKMRGQNNMHIIFKLTDEDFNIEPKEMNNYRLRKASRGIIVREDGKIALQNKSNKNEYKLIGGGMEDEEDPRIAFKREALEEAGCGIEIIEELGTTEEYKSLENLKQISHIFVAKVTNDLHQLNLTEKEKSEGAKLLWVSPEEALELITDCYDKLLPSDYDDVYDTRFVVLRDRKILQYYLKNIR